MCEDSDFRGKIATFAKSRTEKKPEHSHTPPMSSVAFIDTEIDPKSGRVLDIGGVTDNGAGFHGASTVEFGEFLQGADFVCGHNIIKHDLRYLDGTLTGAGIDPANVIDTLFLSPLLFPTRPYHALLKDDKLLSDAANNPLNDSIKARDLFHDEVAAWRRMAPAMRRIMVLLLGERAEFGAFFRYVEAEFADSAANQNNPDNPDSRDTSDTPEILTDSAETLIRRHFAGSICDHAPLGEMIAVWPVEVAYCLALVDSLSRHVKIRSITPPWVLKNFPAVERVMFRLRNKPCGKSCEWCDSAHDPHRGLKRWFGYDTFRSYGGEPLQQRAAEAAIAGRSLLAIFPSGGGKSITFQLPALMSGESAMGLTVVISPLQSLMKDQVDNLEGRGITDAVTINGLLDPIERAESIERVADGTASILYISPELLRSRTIEKLILGRKVVRFVIDEAHCFSSWGHDFRVDYLYIGEFIKRVAEVKGGVEPIPVSCFTATAKRRVVEDIRGYFREKLGLELDLFAATPVRENLHFRVIERRGDEEKYQTVRDMLDEKACPTIVYVSRTYRAHTLAERLCADGFVARAYHGKMDPQEKTANQNAFIAGEVPIIVATSAFGMGVDKKDVGLVIHYDISDSIENYTQEAGRAGRDEGVTAECVVLFGEDDIDKHFVLLNQTRLSIKEIRQVWRAVKDITRFRSQVSVSSLEIARKAGWDESATEVETRVMTALAALEDVGYVRRGQNMPEVYANSILAHTAQEAIDRVMASERFDERQKEKATRIIKKLFASRSRKSWTGEIPESRVDHIGDHLGIVKAEVILIINLLRSEGILSDARDLSAYIRRGEPRGRSRGVVASMGRLERTLLPIFEERERMFHLKQINEWAESRGCGDTSVERIKTIIGFWAMKGWLSRRTSDHTRGHIVASLSVSPEAMAAKMQLRHALAMFTIGLLHQRSLLTATEKDKDEVAVEFSVLEIKLAFENSMSSFGQRVTVEDVEETLFYLSRIEAIRIEGGFLVIYNRITIERLETNNHKQYTREDYRRLSTYYDNKVQQIHIVGEYARLMLVDPPAALRFVEDYFGMEHNAFLTKYFDSDRQMEMRLAITPSKYRELFGGLSPTQLRIINDAESKYIAVAAGPGSGKTRVLVHKLASLLLMENVKHEQLLMLTFSRAAATEFKKRLLKLIGGAANFVEIKTFHSYCFDLLGRVGSLEKSDEIIRKTVDKIRRREVEPNRIIKTVLVIDEAQDMDEDEFTLVRAIMEQNEEMRVIAVGDDDQSIFEFRGADSRYFEQFATGRSTQRYELVENYRSRGNLVDFSNSFVAGIGHRLKRTPIVAQQTDNGRIRVVRYIGGNLVTPLVTDLVASRPRRSTPRGTTCVLTRTNEEALQIAGSLLRNGLKAQLIQSNEGFNISNMAELRFFVERLESAGEGFVISDATWNKAKRELNTRFRGSSRLAVCGKLIGEFETVNPKRRYRSDLEVFIRESRLEDFADEQSDTIFVSTMHKAKGREFDNVVLMLDNFNHATDEAKRLLYVAMTRAKNELTIHLNSDFLDEVSVAGLERIEDNLEYEPPDGITLHLTLKDIWLDYFLGKQKLLAKLRSGDVLTVIGDECVNGVGQPVVQFSRRMMTQIDELRSRGYRLTGARVNFLLYWQKEDSDREFQILLPELFFESRGKTMGGKAEIVGGDGAANPV
jgi:ATP-dependent DNA helicase RecQ